MNQRFLRNMETGSGPHPRAKVKKLAAGANARETLATGTFFKEQELLGFRKKSPACFHQNYLGKEKKRPTPNIPQVLKNIRYFPEETVHHWPNLNTYIHISRNFRCSGNATTQISRDFFFFLGKNK